MKRNIVAGLALFLSALPFCVNPASGGEREVRLRGLSAVSSAGARAESPRLRRFPDVIGSGPLRPILPGSGRTYEDILAGKALAPEATLRIALFRIEFENDSAGDLTTGDGRFDLSDGRDTWLIDAPPHDSTYMDTHMQVLGRFLYAQSYGRVNLEWRIFPDDPRAAYRLDDTADYLPAGSPGSWTMQDQTDHLIQFCVDAIRLVDDTDSNVVFADYDGFMLVHAGPDLQTDVNGDSPGDIPSFFLSFGDEDEIFVDKRSEGDSLRVNGVTVVPEYASQDGFWFGLNGVIAHEMGHQLGLPDLYNTAYSWPAIGYWGLMDSGGLLSIDAGDVYLGSVIPASFCAWSKAYLGWVRPEVITSSRALRLACATDLEPVEDLPRYAVVPVNDKEYYLLENRCGLAEGAFAAKLDTVNNVILGPVSDDEEERFTYDYDYALPGWGLLVWHINERKLDPESLFWTNDVNVDYFDRGVELEEADGIKDLGNPYSAYWEGSAYDPYYEGNAVRFGPDTAPNSNLTDGAPSLVTIDGVGPPGRIIDLTLELGRAVPGWPVPLHEDTLAVIPSGLVAAATGAGNAIAAFWSVVDTAGVEHPWLTVASPGDTSGPTLQRVAAPGPLRGRPVAGDAVPALPGEEILAILGGRAYRIDPSAEEVLIDLGSCGAAGVLAGPILLNVTEDEGLEMVLAEGESLSVYGVDENAVRVVLREHLPYGILSNLTAPRMEDGTPVVVYVAGDGVIDVDTLNGAPAAKRGPAAVAKREGGAPPVTVFAADLDGEPGQEIVFVTDYGTVGALTGDGSAYLPGWPDSVEGGTTGEPFLCDRNGDGEPEIAIPAGPRLVLLEKNGVLAEDTPYGIPPYLDFGYDLGGNGIAGAIAGENIVAPLVGDGGGRIWLWEKKEKAFEGWPVSTGSGASAVVAAAIPGAAETALFSLPDDGFLYAFPAAEIDLARLLWAGPGGGGEGRFSARDEALAEPHSPGGGAAIARAYVYPNPARGEEATVRYRLTAPADVTVRLHDLTGERVSVVLSEPTGYFGENEVVIRTGDLASGLYFVRVEAGSEVELVKLAVLR
ncbi:MAG: immune inhibitor A [Candidatus Eisenbacteria bacterium]|nr:immune inhibitor A [Candidatus Eisenbacteria bacterium]